MNEFYLCFIETDRPHWWNRFLRVGYRHCYSLLQLAPGVVLALNPRMVGLEIALLSGDVMAHVRGRVLKVRTPGDGYTLSRWPLMTCATVVAYHIGLPVRALTPWRLWRTLIHRYGAEVVI